MYIVENRRDANESVVDPLTDEAGKKVDEESKNEKLNPVSDEETPVEKESLRIPLPVGACFFVMRCSRMIPDLHLVCYVT